MKMEKWEMELRKMGISDCSIQEIRLSSLRVKEMMKYPKSSEEMVLDMQIRKKKTKNKTVKSKQMKCPVCSEKLVKIVYGMPDVDLWKKAEQRKVFIGGCCVSECSPKYHCYKCRKSFSKDLKTNIDEDDDWLQED